MIGAPTAPPGRDIVFLVSALADERQPPRIRRLTNVCSVDDAIRELARSLQLPAGTQFVYLAPEFNEWVAMEASMEELASLPAKCRVRPVDATHERADVDAASNGASTPPAPALVED